MKSEENSFFSFELLSEKDVKSLKILELIRDRGIISRTEISRLTGINVVSISNYIKHYIDKKLIHEKGFDVSTGGRKPELVELNKDENYFLGVEIRGDYIHAVLADISLSIVKSSGTARRDGGAKALAEEASGLISGILKKAGIDTGVVRAAGVGVAGDGYQKIAADISSKLGVPVFAGDAASCAAFGERELNKDMLKGDLLYVYSDLGSAVVIREDGNSVRGCDSKYLNPWQGPLGILELAINDVSRGVGTLIVEMAKGDVGSIGEEMVMEAARREDEVAESIMRFVGMGLGLRIAYLVNLFSPKHIVIGGGLEKAGDIILSPIKKSLKKLALREKAKDVTVAPAKIGEESVSLGAAFLAAREVFLKS